MSLHPPAARKSPHLRHVEQRSNAREAAVQDIPCFAVSGELMTE